LSMRCLLVGAVRGTLRSDCKRTRGHTPWAAQSEGPRGSAGPIMRPRMPRHNAMATFETLPGFEAGWRRLTKEQRAAFRTAMLDAFASSLPAQVPPLGAGPHVKEIIGAAGIFEISWGDNGRATFCYGAARQPGEPHVVWRQIGIIADATR
jgi:hypothetical protein